MKTLSITHSIIYHYQKEKNSFFCEVKVTENPEAPKGPLTDRVLFRFHFDRIFLRFLSGRVLLRVLSDSVFSESSVIGSSSGSSVIDSFLGSSVLFFRHAAIF